MHSSRMRTREGSTWSGGVYLVQGDTWSGGCTWSGGVLGPGGGLPGTPPPGPDQVPPLGPDQVPPLLTESQSGVKILPWPNFVAAGNKSFMVCLLFLILIPTPIPMELDFTVISRRGYIGHRLIPMHVSIPMQMGTSPNGTDK